MYAIKAIHSLKLLEFRQVSRLRDQFSSSGTGAVLHTVSFVIHSVKCFELTIKRENIFVKTKRYLNNMFNQQELVLMVANVRNRNEYLELSCDIT